ncbi:glycosyltransferase family 39 protein [Jiulongibacter sp. NS-SX5]|uniref:glycosyltransferase family 39 protein n=1 Tax=Jiulongibacter sp. NS-SX5 TaxID=3463854 RepID=UPI00405A444B
MFLDRKENQHLSLLFLVLLGFLLRVYGIDQFGLAGDEKYSLFVSQFTSYQGNNQKDSVRKPGNEVFTAKEFWSSKNTNDFYDAIARVDTGNGAFFTYLLHWWTKLFGVSDMSLRMLPLLFTLGIIPLIFRFVKEHFHDPKLAITVSALASFSPFLVSYAQVARNYGVLFFFALLSTHWFLQLLKSEFRSKKWWLYVIAYGVSAAICELNHLSTISLFFIHFIYLIIYYRKWSHFLAYSMAMIIPFASVLWWLTSEGGAYIFEYVSNSVHVYNEKASAAPYEYLSKTSFSTVVLQIRHVISSMFIQIDGFYDHVEGKKLGLAAFSVLMANFIIWRTSLKTKLKHLIGFISLIVLVILSKGEQLFLPVFVLNTGLTFIGIRSLFKEYKNKSLLVFIVLLSSIPIFFLALYAIQDDNTFRVITRYAGFGYTFCLVLTALIYHNLLLQKTEWRPWVWFGIIAQFIQIGFLLTEVYSDTQPRYFSDYPVPREKNPYTLIANKVLENASEGDTLIHPSDSFYMENDIKIPSVIDAQLVNFYLPKDHTLPQRIDFDERNKVLLQKKDGSRIELFDFKGDKYRY